MDLSFTELTNAVSQKLTELQYKPTTIRRYWTEWNRFAEYLSNNSIFRISTQIVHDYFYERYSIKFDAPAQEHTRNMRGTIRALWTLIEFQQSGIIYRRIPAKEHKWPDCYEKPISDFMKVIAETMAVSSVRQYRSHLESFSEFLVNNRCTAFNNLTPELICSYWESRKHLRKTTLAYDTYVLRKLFDFLYENGYCTVDYSVFVPNVKVNSKGQIPSFYTTDELSTLLKMVDRSSPIGKRNYAILLFAIRYGMRVGDIRTLTLSSFDWANSKFSFTVSKSPDKRMEFDLLPDVATALIDYFQNGRPKTDCKYVFIRHNAPYEEFGKDNNLHSIISKYMNMAEFADFNHRKHGLHSMRHSIAGNMLRNGVPMPTVSEFLGHSSTETTMIYTKISLDQLSICALEVD